VVSFKSLPLYPLGKRPKKPLHNWLCRPKNRSGTYGNMKILHPTGTWNSHLSVVESVASRYINSDIAARSPTTVAREIWERKLGLVKVHEVRWYRNGTDPAGHCYVH
jgi:hypothetical protein